MLKLNSNDRYYIVFKYFWLIVLLPKTVQLIVFFLLVFYLSRNKISFENNTFMRIQVGILIVYFLSIGLSLLRFPHDTHRVLATVNTFGITVISLAFYNIYSKVYLNLRKIGKYSFFNTIILGIFLLVYFVYPNSRNLVIFGNTLSAIDYYHGVTTRFVGFFAYANLIPFFSIISLPFIIVLLGKKHIIGTFFIFTLSFAFSYSANSRSGQLIVLLDMMLFLFYGIALRFHAKNRLLFYTLTLLLTTLFLACASSLLWGQITDMFMSRTGSNSMRMQIYQHSIQLMLEKSPIIGMGIKDLYGGTMYPYGSHSSYLGYFYKTGLIGGIAYIFSFIILMHQYMKWHKKSIIQYMLIVSLVSGLIWMILEDLDGTNWSICMFYILLGIINSLYKGKKNEQDIKVSENE